MWLPAFFENDGSYLLCIIYTGPWRTGVMHRAFANSEFRLRVIKCPSTPRDAAIEYDRASFATRCGYVQIRQCNSSIASNTIRSWYSMASQRWGDLSVFLCLFTHLLTGMSTTRHAHIYIYIDVCTCLYIYVWFLLTPISFLFRRTVRSRYAINLHARPKCLHSPASDSQVGNHSK